MLKKLILTLTLVSFTWGDTPKFGDGQIAIMIEEYFHSSREAPELMGHQFYASKYEQVIQIEIDTKEANVNDALLFGFKAMSQIANVAKTPFTQSVLVIHFGDHGMPVVASAFLDCSKEFFLDGTMKEDAWRKHCLIIGENN